MQSEDTWMELHALHRHGWSIAALAREFGLDWRTARKYATAAVARRSLPADVELDAIAEAEMVQRGAHSNFKKVEGYFHTICASINDEVVHGKGSLISRMPGDRWQKFANLRLLFAHMWTHPGKKLLFMGGEIAQWTEWNHDAELDWALLGQPMHDGIQRLICDLNRLYRDELALHQSDMTADGFRWVSCDDSVNSVYSYIRQAKDPDDFLLIVVNFTPIPRHDYKVGVPVAGFYSELLNSDAGYYGGGNIGNQGGIHTDPVPAHGHAQSLRLTQDLILFTTKECPKFNPMNVCSYHLQEAGATPAQELAYALATAVAILDGVKAAGMSEEDFAQVVGRISFFVNAGIRFITEMCKMRAFAEMWEDITLNRYGVADPKQRLVVVFGTAEPGDLRKYYREQVQDLVYGAMTR